MHLSLLRSLSCGALAAALLTTAIEARTAAPLEFGVVCDLPIPLPGQNQAGGSSSQNLSGTTNDAQLMSPCDSGTGYGVWYEFRNNYGCDRILDFTYGFDALPATPGFFAGGACGGDVVVCNLPSDAPVGTATVVIPAGETLSFWVWGDGPGQGFFLMYDVYLPAGEDADGDGLPDFCDPCFGSDLLDSDGDGVPDDCDPCPFFASPDCDANGVDDVCDLTDEIIRRVELFNGSTLPSTTLVGDAAVLVENAVRVGEDTDSVVDGNVLFEPLTPTRTDFVEIRFYVRAEPTPNSSQLVCMLYDADTYPSGTPVQGAGSADGLVAGIVKTPNGADNLNVSYLGTPFASVPLPFDVDDGQWREYVIGLESDQIWAWYRMPGEAEQLLLSGVTIPGFTPFRARYGFGALSADGLFDHKILLDQVVIEDSSLLYDRDIDGNGLLDSCESLEYTLEPGSSGNPIALFPVGAVAPTMASTYSLELDHTSFMPNAVLDFLWLSLGALDVSIYPAGALLVSWPPVKQFVRPAGAAFSIPIPYDPTLYGLPLFFQGVGYDPTLGTHELQFTNSVETPISGWRPGL